MSGYGKLFSLLGYTAAKNSSLKSMSVLLQKILKHIKCHFRNYCNASNNWSSNKVYVILTVKRERKREGAVHLSLLPPFLFL